MHVSFRLAVLSDVIGALIRYSQEEHASSNAILLKTAPYD